MRTAKDFAWFKTKQQYDNKIGTADVDRETICFISDDHTIYTHNTQFGGNGGQNTTYEGSSSININNNVISVNQDWVDGRINNIVENITPGESITLATDSKIGGFKTGYPETVSKTYRVQLDGQGRAFVYVPWMAAEIDPQDPNAEYYQQLQERIDSLQSLINGLREDLNSIHQLSQQEIDQMIKDILSEAEWLKQNFPTGEIFHIDDYFNDINGYLKSVGLINQDGTMGWSSILLTIDNLAAQVNAIEQSIGQDGEINLEALRAGLEAYIDGRIAGLNLTTKYAVLDENQKVIEWMTSGFKAQAGKTEGDDGYKVNFAQMYSDDFDGVRNATAAMRTEIEHDTDGKITNAKAWMSAQLENNLAGVITNAGLDSAVTTLFAENSDTGAKAAVLATVKGDESFIDLIADKVSITGDLIANKIYGTDLTLTGKVTATNVDVHGTIRADNLYRNVCFCAAFNDSRSYYYSNNVYQYIEPWDRDGNNNPISDGLSYLEDGRIYSAEELTTLRNNHPEDESWWDQYYVQNSDAFVKCTGNADVIEVGVGFTRDHDELADNSIILPHPKYCQGKYIELYSDNFDNVDYSKPYLFKVGAVGGNTMTVGAYHGGSGFATSAASEFAICQTGVSYRFAAVTVNNNPVWVKLTSDPQYHKIFAFDYDHYFFLDGDVLKYKDGNGGIKTVSLN